MDVRHVTFFFFFNWRNRAAIHGLGLGTCPRLVGEGGVVSFSFLFAGVAVSATVFSRSGPYVAYEFNFAWASALALRMDRPAGSSRLAGLSAASSGLPSFSLMLLGSPSGDACARGRARLRVSSGVTG